jgi:hypothetical protein
MKTTLIPTKLLWLATALLTSAPATVAAADYEWTLDPRPFSERRTKLAEVAVHRFVPQAGTGVVLERNYLLTANGLMSPVEDRPVPAAVTIPERAYNKLLIAASSWLAYGKLGPKALENFELVNDLEPIDIAGRWHYEIKVAAGARGNVGHVPNLSTRAEVTPTTPAIGGFVIEDMPRLVLIRAIGPGLAQFGVSNALPSARVRLFRYDVPVATNDDWNTNSSHGNLVATTSARAGAFPLSQGTKDAALAIVLAPGTYTVHASGATPASGAVLLEVYLLD